MPLLPLWFVLPPLALVVVERVPKLPSDTTLVFPSVIALSPFVVVAGLPPEFAVVVGLPPGLAVVATLVVVGGLTVVDALLPVVNPSAFATEAHEAATTRAVTTREAAVEADTDLALMADKVVNGGEERVRM